MHDHDLAVAGKVQIHFNVTESARQGAFKGDQRVFRGNRIGAPMAHDTERISGRRAERYDQFGHVGADSNHRLGAQVGHAGRVFLVPQHDALAIAKGALKEVRRQTVLRPIHMLPAQVNDVSIARMRVRVSAQRDKARHRIGAACIFEDAHDLCIKGTNDHWRNPRLNQQLMGRKRCVPVLDIRIDARTQLRRQRRDLCQIGTVRTGLRKVSPCQPRYRLAVRQLGVVKDHRNTVPGCTNVHLPHVRAQHRRFAKCRDGVAGRIGRGAPMGD